VVNRLLIRYDCYIPQMGMYPAWIYWFQLMLNHTKEWCHV